MNDQDFDKLPNGLKILLYANDDSNTNMITLKTYPNPDYNDDSDDSEFLYEVYNVYDKNVYDNINDAYNKLFKLLENIPTPSDSVRFNNKYINYQNIFYNSLITKKKFLTKELIQYSRETNIVFCQSKYYNNYIDSINVFDDDENNYIHIDNNDNDFLLKYKSKPVDTDLSHQDDIYIFTKDIFRKLKYKYRFTII